VEGQAGASGDAAVRVDVDAPSEVRRGLCEGAQPEVGGGVSAVHPIELGPVAWAAIGVAQALVAAVILGLWQRQRAPHGAP
jgi:lysozyme family protein